MAEQARITPIANNALQECPETLFCPSGKSRVEFVAVENGTSCTTQGMLASGGVAQLENARRITLAIDYYKNSKGRLAIDSEMYTEIMQKFDIDSQINEFATHFRYKIKENDFAHPPCIFQPVLPKRIKTSPPSYECFYALRVPGLRQGLMAHDLQKWSIRQLAVYQKHDAANDKTTQIFLGISLNRSETGRIIRHYAQDLPSSTVLNFSLHSTLFHHAISSWKAYLADRYDKVEKISEELLFKKRREDLNQFRDRSDFKEIKESLLNLPLMIVSLAGTIRRLQKEFGQAFPHTASSIEHEKLTTSYAHHLEETNLLLKRTEMLQERIRDLIAFTQDNLNHLNSKHMMQVAQSTKNDSAAMKYITIITVLFLPATFVATFFSMQLVNVSDGGFHLSGQVWIYFAVTTPLTFLTIMGWLLGMRREKARQRLSDSQNSDAMDPFDVEHGTQLSEVK